MEPPQTNCTMSKTYSDKIIPAKKRNKLLSCIVIKEQHLYACLEPHTLSFSNNITGSPTEIQHLFSILFISFVLLK